MLDLFSNGLQFAVAAGSAAYMIILASKTKNQQYFILACFYVTFALGSIYWLIYLLKSGFTPRFFYVSDLSWIASYLFLMMLCVSVASPEEKGYRPAAAWIVTAILTAMTVYMLQKGDIIVTLIWNGLTIACGFLSVRGFLSARKKIEKAREKQVFYGTVIALVIIEFGLWMASCFFYEVTWSNPYIWFDMALTCSLVALLFAAKKVIGP
ncbi:MAG TPA: hypothetical protein P5198_10690 [Flexilinea sp.]|nr:hypothetical protein [Flexilinea sp.]